MVSEGRNTRDGGQRGKKEDREGRRRLGGREREREVWVDQPDDPACLSRTCKVHTDLWVSCSRWNFYVIQLPVRRQ